MPDGQLRFIDATHVAHAGYALGGSHASSYSGAVQFDTDFITLGSRTILEDNDVRRCSNVSRPSQARPPGCCQCPALIPASRFVSVFIISVIHVVGRADIERQIQMKKAAPEVGNGHDIDEVRPRPGSDGGSAASGQASGKPRLS